MFSDDMPLPLIRRQGRIVSVSRNDELPQWAVMLEKAFRAVHLRERHTVSLPPGRFRKRSLTLAVVTGLDPFGVIRDATFCTWSWPRCIGASTLLKTVPRAKQLSVPEKVFQLFRVALGFFGVRKVDARNCP